MVQMEEHPFHGRVCEHLFSEVLHNESIMKYGMRGKIQPDVLCWMIRERTVFCFIRVEYLRETDNDVETQSL